ncbi:LpxI family protein [Oceaniglobus trochenteri]|uniref:LpxI family protein n=1 Tax=Oceaniglobus trochenteri TaxID=2763260 RepID=UPI001CFF8017|nr:UDP-2,3-diacylglucosamine diphosphatase LpxI [Oceaniglobus trochenteri]
MSLCLIAGQGRLPVLLAEMLAEGGAPLLLAQLEGSPWDGPARDDVLTFRLETLGSLIETLVARGVTRACFAGAIRRPVVDPARIDAATLPLVPRLMAALGQGDDGALRVVLDLFQEAGIAIVAAHDLLPGLLADEGVLTRATPGDLVRGDASRAAGIVAAMGQADVGQGCVVLRGQALAIEAQAGTDWMLRSLALMAQDAGTLPAPPPTRGGILFKAPKPGQDRRIDLPAIGPDTVALAAELGLAGIVVAAGGVLLLDRELMVARANAAGLFLWVRA